MLTALKLQWLQQQSSQDVEICMVDEDLREHADHACSAGACRSREHVPCPGPRVIYLLNNNTIVL